MEEENNISITNDGNSFNFELVYSNRPDESLNPLSQVHNSKRYGKTLLQADKYIVKGVIGKGSFGVVYRVTNNNCTYALKELVPIKQAMKIFRTVCINYKNEINILQKLDHKNIIKTFDVIEESRPPKATFVVMEYARLGPIMRKDMKSHGKFKCPLTGGVMNEELAAKSFSEIFDAMKYIHSLGIAHRDLKLDNILFNIHGSIRIVDFGVSRVFPSGFPTSGLVMDTVGTPQFYAPEMCNWNEDMDESIGHCAFKADVWATAVCLWICLFGMCPFIGENEPDLFHRISLASPTKPHPVSPKLETVLLAMMEKNPEQRISFEKCCDMDFISSRDQTYSVHIPSSLIEEIVSHEISEDNAFATENTDSGSQKVTSTRITDDSRRSKDKCPSHLMDIFCCIFDSEFFCSRKK